MGICCLFVNIRMTVKTRCEEDLAQRFQSAARKATGKSMEELSEAPTDEEKKTLKAS